ncbi:sensor histidine kinase [Mucilaginibacter arboris]|uniref:histidine kinase n=1 Tax=Mucilaginibacter arboris TaxID=2682090 RepID=A0A7K1SV87_9SPHI|nr:7TM diverse intracellular signaling domain-containing protein [Mucilaginibacter arboris]MVN21241.1 GHKL domain-containing protein [Mucilaginibacter arboris]
MKFIYIYLFLIFASTISYAQDIVIFNNPNKFISISDKVEILEDKQNLLSIKEVIASKLFKKSSQKIPNFQITKSSIWIKLKILNNTQLNNLTLELPYPTIDSISLISVINDSTFNVENTGEYIPIYKRTFHHQNYAFNLNIKPKESKIYFLKLKASEQIQLPLLLGSEKSILESNYSLDLIFGIYAGIILVMLFYNLFVYFSIKDNTYLLYVLYILSVGFTQGSVQGYTARFLYPNSIHLANLMIVVAPVFSGVFAILFAKKFILIKKHTPILNSILSIIIVFYFIILTLGFWGFYHLSAQLVQINAGLASITVMATSYIILRMNYKPALFFFIAWSIFLTSVVIFVLRNFNILPYNTFTYYALQIGSALEVVLLSFALADKINIYKKEKEESQAQALSALQENARIIKEQNITLERKVEERTDELVTTNHNLNKTLTDLKEAQIQLVEAEKMASLGQLTAGIAHEINNPINFVTSNIAPLKRDVDILVDAIFTIESVGLSNISTDEKQQQIEDYKEDIDLDYLKIEINHLLNGIHEGANRTADIVKGLKIFSRLDEDDLKKADINEGLASTLIIANNLIGSKIQVIKNYGDIPPIDCYPGKLNQVFLNIISNGVFAINEKFGDQSGGILEITTQCDEQNLYIKIKDNGTGMSEETKKKIFEPFFTTKNVGVGTGLGMSIVYNTINKHNGQIYVNSAEGVGTEFILELQLQFKEAATI